MRYRIEKTTTLSMILQARSAPCVRPIPTIYSDTQELLHVLCYSNRNCNKCPLKCKSDECYKTLYEKAPKEEKSRIEQSIIERLTTWYKKRSVGPFKYKFTVEE